MPIILTFVLVGIGISGCISGYSELSATGEKRISFRHVFGGVAETPGFDSVMEQSLAVHIVGPAAPGMYAKFHYDESKEMPLQGTMLNWKSGNWGLDAGEIPLDMKSGLFAKQRDMMGLRMANSFGWAMVGELDGTVHRETISGNGSRGPYLMANEDVIYGSEVVVLEGRNLRRNLDYTVDWESGTLWFMKPLTRGRKAEIAYDHRGGNPQMVTGAGGEVALGGMNFDYKMLRHEEDKARLPVGAEPDDLMVQALGINMNAGPAKIRLEGAFSSSRGEDDGQAVEALLRAGSFNAGIRHWDSKFQRLDKSGADLSSEAEAFWKNGIGTVGFRAREDMSGRQGYLMSLARGGGVISAEKPPEDEIDARYAIDVDRNFRPNDTGVYSLKFSGVQSVYNEEYDNHEKEFTAAAGINFQERRWAHRFTGGIALGFGEHYRNVDLRTEGNGLLGLPWLYELRSTEGDDDSLDLKAGFRTLKHGWSIFPYLMTRHETGFGEALRVGLESRRSIGKMSFFTEVWNQNGAGGIGDGNLISLGFRGNTSLARITARLSMQDNEYEKRQWKSFLSLDSREFAGGRLKMELKRDMGTSSFEDSFLSFDRRAGDGIVVSIGARRQYDGEEPLTKMEFTMLAVL